jgi:hypothetical protein
MRLHMPQQGGTFARVAHAIAEADAMLGRSIWSASSRTWSSAT